MAATKAQMNWKSVVAGSTTITRVTTGSFKFGGKLVKFSGDADVWVTVIGVGPGEPSAQFSTADIATLMSIQPGASGSLVAKLNDAELASGGGITFTLANAVFENADGSNTHGQIGVGTGTWQAYSVDGTTNPLTLGTY